MSCYDEWFEMIRAGELGERSDEYNKALGKYLACMEHKHKARAAHGSAWDERMLQHWEFLRECWEKMFGHINIPPRPPWSDDRSVAVREEIFRDSEKAMIFSKSIEQAFQKSGIQLGNDETFACLICVQKKPAHVSEEVSPSLPAYQGQPYSPLSFITEPEIMQQELGVIDRNRIKYADAEKAPEDQP